VQAEEFYDSIRTGLIAMLPRLMRFADILVGERRAGAALLGRALGRMLAEEHCYQRGTPLDRWAFGEIYRLWLEEQRDYGEPHYESDDATFAALVHNASGEAPDAFITGFLLSLPPPQRLTLLLVYGERFDHGDAGRVLDVSAETISARLLRISAGLADQLSERATAPSVVSVEEQYAEGAAA